MTIKISLPEGKKLLIKEGDKVGFETPLIKITENKHLKIPISQILDVSPKKIFLSLTKNIGEAITQGDVLARKKTLFSEKKYISEFTGILKEIDHTEGTVTLAVQEKEGEKINSYFKGEVKKINDDNLEFEVKEVEKFELKEASDYFGGEVVTIDNINLNKIKDEIRNKILLVKKIEIYNQLKLEVIGASGYITIDPLSKHIDIPYARLLNSQDWEKIKKLNFPYVSINKKENIIYFYR
ncbi:MAG: hypothetical protein ABH812_00060 [bacterium]